MTTRIEIIDDALVMIGAQPLQVETVRGADRRIREYRAVVTGLLTGYPWWFSVRVRKLNKIVGEKPAQWLYRFALPADMLGGPRAAYDRAPGNPFHAWELVASEEPDRPGELHSDAEEVWLRYAADVAPQFWTGYFRVLVLAALKAQFALSVREDGVLAERLRKEAFGTPEERGAGGVAAQARAQDAQSKPSQSLTLGNNPLIDVRR